MATTHGEIKHHPSTKSFEIILEDLDFTFAPSDMSKAAIMWDSGATDEEIADAIRPHGNRQTALDEITLLLMHLRRKKRLETRP